MTLAAFLGRFRPDDSRNPRPEVYKWEPDAIEPSVVRHGSVPVFCPAFCVRTTARLAFCCVLDSFLKSCHFPRRPAKVINISACFSVIIAVAMCKSRRQNHRGCIASGLFTPAV